MKADPTPAITPGGFALLLAVMCLGMALAVVSISRRQAERACARQCVQQGQQPVATGLLSSRQTSCVCK